MDPVSAIAEAVGKITESVFTFLTVSKDAKYGRLPDWITPRDFQRKSNTANILLIGMFAAIIIIIIALTVAARRAK